MALKVLLLLRTVEKVLELNHEIEFWMPYIVFNDFKQVSLDIFDKVCIEKNNLFKIQFTERRGKRMRFSFCWFTPYMVKLKGVGSG